MRDLNVDVDAVKQRARDALLVFCDHRGRAGAGLLAVAVVAALAGIDTIEHALRVQRRVTS